MASTSSISGLASGLDTDSIITNLMAIEARPQTLLQTKLSENQSKATAYRAVNTRFDALRTAAEALSTTNLQAARSATSTSTSVTAAATTSATPGSSVTFDVVQLATKHSLVLDQNFTSTSDPVTVPVFPITVMSADGTSELTTIDVPEGASLLDVVSAVNSNTRYGLNATIVQLGDGKYRLQIDTKTSGEANAFSLTDADGNAIAATVRTQGQDAKLDLGLDTLATSSTNTFGSLITGTAVTVSEVEEGVTVSVATDTSGLSSKVQALVDAANGALGLIKAYTVSAAGGDLAILQGDRSLTTLADQVLDAVSSAVGGYGSAATLGLQLTRDGKLTFDSATFASAVAADPAKVTAMIAGTPETTTDGVTTPAVTGIAQRLTAIATSASDSSTGSLTLLAQGRDTLIDNIQDRIDGWTLTLEKRKATLTAQFTALETALSTLKSQSSWLSSQIDQLYNPSAS